MVQRCLFWSLAFLVLVGSRPALAGPIAFTGNVQQDFSTTNITGNLNSSPVTVMNNPLDLGEAPFISANGTNDGILWTIDQGQPLQTPLGPGATTNATLYAYDATNLSNLLYSSSAIPGDVPGFGIKFSSPIVANGKVYISTGKDPVTASQPQGEIDVYGLN